MDKINHENNRCEFIILMSNFDHLDLNGHSLNMFLTVYEEQSVTRAARRLDVGQSAVSHMLDKLRAITGDALFVRSGRGITPTPRAAELAKQIRPLLAALQQLTTPAEFNPGELRGEISIGASAMQRELIVPQLARVLRAQAPHVDLRVINSGVDSAPLLRKRHCDILITPGPPDGTEFIQTRLFADDWVCFHDPSTAPPLSLAAYTARPHAKVVFSDDERSQIDDILLKKGLERRMALRIASFSALPSLMRGTDLVIALPRFIRLSFMRGFAHCPLPFAISPLSFHMAWHAGMANAPYHQWLRRIIKQIVSDLDLHKEDEDGCQQ